MISETYDIREFFAAMIGKDYHEMLSAALDDIRGAEARSYSVRGAPQARKLGSNKYASQLKAFKYFMTFWSRPGSASDWEFGMYKSICKSLVEKEQLDSKALDLFN